MSCADEEKKSGSVFKMLPVLLGIAAITVLSFMYTGYIKDMDIREQASQIAREYMLRMEAKGYLDYETGNMFMSELRELGIYDINLTGTTTSDVGYGNEIALVVNANIRVTEYEITDLFNVDTDSRAARLHIVRKSTAKN